MKRVLVLFALLFFLSSVSAMKITEVELDPFGKDIGNEWIELYSSSEINLSDYKIINNDADEITLEGNFSGYYIYTFNKQWLDNTGGEKVYLYYGEELVDETDLFLDSKNNNLTWQICDGSWEFKNSTKGVENECDTEEEEIVNESEEEPAEELVEESPDESEEVINTSTTETEEETEENKTLETIYLNPKDIKSERNMFNLDKSTYAIFGFISFCILILLLFILKKNKFRKNEFT